MFLRATAFLFRPNLNLNWTRIVLRFRCLCQRCQHAGWSRETNPTLEKDCPLKGFYAALGERHYPQALARTFGAPKPAGSGDNIASMTHLLCRRPLQLARLRASDSTSHRCL